MRIHIFLDEEEEDPESENYETIILFNNSEKTKSLFFIQFFDLHF